MKTDIWALCSTNITNKNRNCKSRKLSMFCPSITWHNMARFVKIIGTFQVKTLTSRMRKIIHEPLHILLSRILPLSLRCATLLQKHLYIYRKSQEYQDVHVNTARCLFRNWKGFEEPITSKRPCKVGNAPKSHSPYLKLRCHGLSSHWRWNKPEDLWWIVPY